MKRLRFLYVILAVLVVASVGPLLFYGLKMLEINRRELETNENLLQSTITRSIAEEIAIHNEAFRQQLNNLEHIVQASSSLLGGPGQTRNSQWRETLERFVSSSPSIIYVTFLDAVGRGVQAGNYSADADPFLVKVLGQAFAAAQQGQQYESIPVLVPLGGNLAPVILVSRPIVRRETFEGMVAAVLNLQYLVERLHASSTNGVQELTAGDLGGRDTRQWTRVLK